MGLKQLAVLWSWLMVVTTVLPEYGLAIQNSKTPTTSTLVAAGQELEAQFARDLEALKAEIEMALPALDASRKDQYSKCREAEVAATAGLEAAQMKASQIGTAQALVDHAKNKWIGGAEKGIAEANAKLTNAKSDEERKAAEADLARWQANKADGLKALEERQAALDQTERERPATEQALKNAEQTLQEAKAQTLASIRALGLEKFLSSHALDAKLAKFVVMHEATPRGLAAFAGQGKSQRELLDRMLADEELLIQMVVADGANGGNYGEAMRIYSEIQQASSKSHEGNLQRLALAISLEHAVPIAQRNAASATGAPANVDPVQRYMHYEQACLGGELDACFPKLSVWEYRMVVDGEEPDEILAWGREMLRNYRPDQIGTPDYRWRYVTSVRTDVKYGSQDNKYDRDDLQFFQNIMMNGGVCGRRAFFGRFILRAFGVPTTARPQKGHAALVHWTPEGWVACLGAGWGSGWTKTRYNRDLDFLANTQARATGEDFMQVKRAQWIGDVMGEKPVYGFLSGNPGFWYGVSLYTQRAIIEDAKSKTLGAVGEDIAEANESSERETIEAVTITEADRKITVASNGVITIPAAATSKPTSSTGKIIFMNSNLGGKQLHYSRNGGAEGFEYTLDVPTAGRYALTARVVTPSWKQSLQLLVNEATQPLEMPLPFTVGMWETTSPIEVDLVQGKNLLRFTRDGDIKGCTIRDFTLTPIDTGNQP